ncbi:MAG: NAD-dependent epimerase/dehydratase family protein [Terriglobia bacterium]
MKYFITGATGFIGSHVAALLIESGHQVAALVRDRRRATTLAALGMKLFEGDIVDPESLRAPMSNVDGIFHLAAWYKIGARDKTSAYKINVDGTRHVLEMMRKLRIRKGVYTSPVAVFSDTHGTLPHESFRYEGPHLSEYDRTKCWAHYRVALPMMRTGLPLVIVQPGAVYGPEDPSILGNTLRQYLRRRLPMIPRTSAFCWSHVDDVARAHLLAMDKGRPGESYIIAGPKHPLVETFEMASSITGIKPPPIRVPSALMKGMSYLVRPFESFIPMPEAYTSEGLRVAAGVTYLGNNEKARRELGYDPRTLKEGLPETLMSMMNELRIKPGAGSCQG